MMLKKGIAALVALMLVFSLCAFADETAVTGQVINLYTDSFGITCVVPEGYTADQVDAGDAPIMLVNFYTEQKNGVNMAMNISFDEEYAGVTLNDLDDEALEALKNELTADVDMLSPAVTLAETSHGTKLIIIDENSETDEYACIVTLYQGYWISLLIARNGYDFSNKLTEADIQVGIELLNETWFTPAA